MSSKKKPRPLFEVPEEVEPGAQSGWVYRSGAGTTSEMSLDAADSSVSSASTATLALTMAAVAQAMILGMTIASIPLRVLNAIVKPDDR